MESINYKEINVIGIEESTPPIVNVEYKGENYKIIDIDRAERQETESYMEYKIRRKFLEWAEKKRKENPLYSWTSVNYRDLAKGHVETSLGTYNKEKFQKEIEEMIKRAKEQKEKEAKETLDSLVEDNKDITYDTIKTEETNEHE